jgi:hypothetical protein
VAAGEVDGADAGQAGVDGHDGLGGHGRLVGDGHHVVLAARSGVSFVVWFGTPPGEGCECRHGVATAS